MVLIFVGIVGVELMVKNLFVNIMDLVLLKLDVKKLFEFV